jgi:DNA-directed RNA polymerase subunit M/transcription elongation factor TFIIS
MQKCCECDAVIILPADCEEGEVIKCPECGLEMEFKCGNLIPITLDGIDWGE